MRRKHVISESGVRDQTVFEPGAFVRERQYQIPRLIAAAADLNVFPPVLSVPVDNRVRQGFCNGELDVVEINWRMREKSHAFHDLRHGSVI